MLSSSLHRSSSCFLLFWASFNSAKRGQVNRRGGKQAEHRQRESVQSCSSVPSFSESCRKDKLQVLVKAGRIRVHCYRALKIPPCSCGRSQCCSWMLWKTIVRGTLITLSHDLTSLLGLGHHLFILLSVFLGLLGWLGRQITVTDKHQRKGKWVRGSPCIIHMEQAHVV